MKEYILEGDGRRRAATRRDCDKCAKSYLARDRDLIKGYGKYCSKVCSANAKSTKVTVCCSYCKTSFEKSPSKIGEFNFCTRACKDKAQRVESGLEFSDMRPSHYATGKTAYRKRVIVDRGLDSCERCGWSEVSKLLQVHHKDHNRTNGSTENLEVLCMNCHAVEHCT